MIIPAFWYSGNTNAGDMVTPWLIRAMGHEPLMCSHDYPGRRLLGCGSIAAHANARSVVWGTGIGEREQRIDPTAEFRAVRGPLTRQRVLECGGACPEVYGDPALLLPRFYSPRATLDAPTWRVGVVPHFVDYKRARSVAQSNALVIDILQPIEAVIDAICACECIVSSSLHGLVFAVAYGKCSAWSKMSNGLCGDDVKFHDFWRSLGNTGSAPCFDLTANSWPTTAELVDLCQWWGHLDTAPLLDCCPIASWTDDLPEERDEQ